MGEKQREPALQLDSLAEITGGYQFPEADYRRQGGDDPAVLLEDKELRRIVLESVRKLPSRLRESALLFYFEGMSVKECAAALGVSVQALKTRLSRARSSVRSQLR